MKEILSLSAEQTFNIGLILGKILKKGDIVCLSGDLGTGKTAFVGGIAKAFSIDSYITSPTFTIVNEYSGEIPLYHFDVYRIGDIDELYDIGFEEYLYSDGVVVIEWAELVKDAIPEENIWIEITKDLSIGTDARKIKIEFKGERYKAYEEEMDRSIKSVTKGSGNI